MKREFKVGDIVFLKSDSPATTVTCVGPDSAPGSEQALKVGEIAVAWFDGGKLELAILPVVCLIPESELFCNDEDCIHCFPTSNCLRDDCPHCKESRADDESDIFPSPENN